MFVSAAWLAAALASAQPATLIIYRDGAEPLLFRPTVIVDGVELGSLGDRRFFAVSLPAGSHRIEARWPAIAGHKPTALTIRIRAGNLATVELTGRAAFWKTRAASALVEQDAAASLARLKDCCQPAR